MAVLVGLFPPPTTVLAAGTPILRKVVLQLRWDHQFQFAGYYAADWMGFFEEEGLDVEIRSAFHESCRLCEATVEVAEGRADFGVGAGDILLARAKGAPLIIVSSIFQKSATTLYARSGVELNSPSDLFGLRVSRQVNSMIDVELQAMLRAEGMNPDMLTTVPLQSSTLPGFLAGDIDVLSGTSIATPFVLGLHGISLSALHPSAYGIDFYGDTLFINEAFEKKHFETVIAFQRAVHKGWSAALMNSESIARRITDTLPRSTNSISPDKIYEFNIFQAEKIISLMQFPYIEVGHVNPHRWDRMRAFLQESGAIPAEADAPTLVFNPNQRLEEERDLRFRELAWAAGSLAILGTVIFVWAFVLRRTVAARTKDLQRTIEDLKETKAALETNTERLQQTNKDLEQFAYVASHDLQEPLRKLVAFSAMLKDDLDGNMSESADKDLHYITDAAQRMQRLVSDLLTFSRVGKSDAPPRSFDLEDRIKVVLSELELVIQETGAKIHWDPLPEVTGDPTLVTQLYQNLISNALKFMPEDGVPEVHLTVEDIDGKVVLGVKDNGIGIAANYQKQVFTPFKRLHGRSKYDGTGIGLAICRRAVEWHGGEIWVESEAGVGSHFKFTLPFKGADQ